VKKQKYEKREDGRSREGKENVRRMRKSEGEIKRK